MMRITILVYNQSFIKKGTFESESLKIFTTKIANAQKEMTFLN